MAKTVSDVLRRYDFTKTDNPLSLRKTSYKTDNPINFWPKGNQHFDPGSNISFMQVIQKEKKIEDFLHNTGHPFLFLSNSYFAHPSKSLGASVPAYVAYYLQTIPDWFYRTGAGNGLLRSLVTNTELLNSRKAIIMVGHPQQWSQKTPSIPSYLLDDKSTVLSLEKTIDDFNHEITINRNEFYTFSVNAENELEIIPVSMERNEHSSSFSFELTIPAVSNKKKCMVRFVFVKSSYITFHIVDKNTKEVIEPGYTLAAETRQGDLFVPIDSSPRTLDIKMTPGYSNAEFVLKNIELWYY